MAPDFRRSFETGAGCCLVLAPDFTIVGVADDYLKATMTAAASPHDRQRGIQAGFHRYITKPIQVDELLTVLEALFGPLPA